MTKIYLGNRVPSLLLWWCRWGGLTVTTVLNFNPSSTELGLELDVDNIHNSFHNRAHIAHTLFDPMLSVCCESNRIECHLVNLILNCPN